MFLPSSGNLGLIFYDFCIKKPGDVINLRGLKKEIVAISQFQPFLGSLWLFIVIFAKINFGDISPLQEVNLWGCYLTYEEWKNCFLS